LNGDFNTPNDREYDYVWEVESDVQQDNSIKDPEIAEQRDVSTTPNVVALIWPTQRSMRQAKQVLEMVHSMETRRNTGIQTY